MKRKMIILVRILSIWFFTHLILITVDGVKDELLKVDVGIVLGNKVELNGQPSERLQSRLEKAIELYQQGYFPYLIVSGGIGKEGFDEAVVMKDYLVNHGIPEAKIILDNKGTNTAMTAKQAKHIMSEKGFRSAMIITQFYHISRTKLAFHQAGLHNLGSAHAAIFEARDLYSLFREFFAYYQYLLFPQSGD